MHGKISFLEPMNYFLFHTKNGNQNPKLSDHFAFFFGSLIVVGGILVVAAWGLVFLLLSRF